MHIQQNRMKDLIKLAIASLLRNVYPEKSLVLKMEERKIVDEAEWMKVSFLNLYGS